LNISYQHYLLVPAPSCDERGDGAFFALVLRLLDEGVDLLFINSENAFFGFCGEVGEPVEFLGAEFA
jgi:hypothetical protein